MRIVSTARALLLLLLVIGVSGCMAGMTGGVERVVSQADRSDPARAAVVDALAVAEQDFAPILGESLSEQERAEMVQDWLRFRAMSQAQSSMDMLRIAENVAESARHVTIGMPGADPIYWEQEIVTSGVQGTQRFVSWRFPVPFEERRQVAQDLTARIAPLFAVDPSWTRSSNTDVQLNPIVANTTFSTYLSMGLDGSSEMLMVSIDYWHDAQNHDAMKGVRVYVAKMSTRTR